MVVVVLFVRAGDEWTQTVGGEVFVVFEALSASARGADGQREEAVAVVVAVVVAVEVCSSLMVELTSRIGSPPAAAAAVFT